MLTAVDLAEVQCALLPLRSRFRDVKVFGSRATGRARRGSDLDLVVYGADRRTLRLIAEALEESFLPMTADVLAYEAITSDLLRNHIDQIAVRLPLEPEQVSGPSQG